MRYFHCPNPVPFREAPPGAWVNGVPPDAPFRDLWSLCKQDPIWLSDDKHAALNEEIEDELDGKQPGTVCALSDEAHEAFHQAITRLPARFPQGAPRAVIKFARVVFNAAKSRPDDRAAAE